MSTLRNTKDDGFSLVELIVVIALIAVISGMGLNLSGVLAGRRAYATSEKLMELMNRTKTETLAWSAGGYVTSGEDVDVLLKLERRSTGMYAVLRIRAEEEEVLLNADRVTMTVYYATGRSEQMLDATFRTVTEAETVRIAYDKKTGALLPVQGDRYLKRIMLTEGDRRYIIRVVPATGYCYVETAADGSPETEGSLTTKE